MSRQQNASLEQPMFIIDTEATDVEATAIHNFYNALLDNPEAARSAVQQLAGQTALEQTVSKPGSEPDDLRGKVRDYFDKKFERRVEFDPDTEEALRNDKEYKRLLSELQRARNLPKASGSAANAKLSWQRREDNIEKHRRNLSQHYLLFFLDRLIDWQSTQELPTPEIPHQYPKAG